MEIEIEAAVDRGVGLAGWCGMGECEARVELGEAVED